MGVGASVVAPTVCAQCNKGDGDNSVNLRVCSGCKLVLYCSRTCQRQHWVAGHKYACESASKRAAAAAAAAAAFEAACAHAIAPACAHATVSQKTRLYGLFKQQAQGECQGQRPSSFKLPRANFDAWAAVKVRVGFYLN